MPIITISEVLNSTVKALTWKQPYAQMMLHGKQETRAWDTNYRGLVLICAGKKRYTLNELKETAGEDGYDRIINITGFPCELLVGHAFAIGRLTGVTAMKESDESKTYVKYKPGRLWVHHYEDVRPIAPIPFSGLQRWKPLDENIKHQIILR